MEKPSQSTDSSKQPALQNRSRFPRRMLFNRGKRLVLAAALTPTAIGIGEVPQLDLLIPVNETFRNSPSFGKTLFYTKAQAEANSLVCLGDSNMVGGMDPAPVSFVDLLIEDLSKKNKFWDLRNYSKVGDSTQDTIRSQVNNPDVINELKLLEFFDVCMNVGGDNLLNIVDTPQKSKELAEVAKDPFGLANLRKTWEIMGEVMQDLGTFGDSFYSLLTRQQELYTNKLQHMIIISAPDFSKAPAISTEFEDGSTSVFPLNSDVLQLFAQNVSIMLNNKIAQAVDAFSYKHPEIPVSIINIFDDFGRDCFDKDEHFSTKGKKKIAQKILACMHVGK